MQWKHYWASYKGRQPLPEDFIFYGRFEGTHVSERAFQLALESGLKGPKLSEVVRTHLGEVCSQRFIRKAFLLK